MKKIIPIVILIAILFPLNIQAGCTRECRGTIVPFANQQLDNDIGIGPHRRLDEGNPKHWGQTGLTAHGKWDSDPRDDQGPGIGSHRRLNSGDPTHWGQWE